MASSSTSNSIWIVCGVLFVLIIAGYGVGMSRFMNLSRAHEETKMTLKQLQDEAHPIPAPVQNDDRSTDDTDERGYFSSMNNVRNLREILQDLHDKTGKPWPLKNDEVFNSKGLRVGFSYPVAAEEFEGDVWERTMGLAPEIWGRRYLTFWGNDIAMRGMRVDLLPLEDVSLEKPCATPVVFGDVTYCREDKTYEEEVYVPTAPDAIERKAQQTANVIFRANVSVPEVSQASIIEFTFDYRCDVKGECGNDEAQKKAFEAEIKAVMSSVSYRYEFLAIGF